MLHDKSWKNKLSKLMSREENVIPERKPDVLQTQRS